MDHAKRSFHIGDILSIATGRLMSLRHMEGVYDILNFMTGDGLFTHALGRAKDEAAPCLLEQHPWLNDVVITDETFIDWPDGMADIEAQWGAYHDVLPMHSEDHDVIDPVQELINMGFEGKIIRLEEDDNAAPSPYGDIDWKSS